MPRPLGDRTRWTFGYYPKDGAEMGRLTIAKQLYSGQHGAEDAADRAAAATGCEVTPPLRVRVEIPKGVRR
jgi:hypothetical protein